LYDADYVNMDEKDLNECTLVKIDPGNNKMLNMLVDNEMSTIRKKSLL